MKMDLDGFIATRVFESPNEYAANNRGDLHETEAGAFVYYGGTVITISQLGSFSLILENQEWNSRDLKELETRLFEYAVVEGLIEEHEKTLEELKAKMHMLMRQLYASGVTVDIIAENLTMRPNEVRKIVEAK